MPVTGASATPIKAGTIAFFAMSSAPAGWLKCNGAQVSRALYAALFDALVTQPGFSSQAFTVTLANPAVFTKTGHGFNNGERLRLYTTGALPTGLNTSTDYFVEKIDANTFYLNLSSRLLDVRISTSGSQSGTHSYLQSRFGLGDGVSTFTLPDLRGEFLRCLDDGRGVDTGRPQGSAQADANKSHTHTFVGSNNQAATQVIVDNGGTATGNMNIPLSTGTNYNSNGVMQPSGGTETRPRNVAVLACIKY